MRRARPRTTVLLLALLCAAALAGCASGERYRPVQVGPEESVVCVYRPKSLVSPGGVRVYIDQTYVGRLGRNEHVAVLVQPGEHLVRVERRSSLARLVYAPRGESTFVEAGAMLLGGAVTLEVPGPAAARDRLATTRAIAPAARLSDIVERAEP